MISQLHWTPYSRKSESLGTSGKSCRALLLRLRYRFSTFTCTSKTPAVSDQTWKFLLTIGSLPFFFLLEGTHAFRNTEFEPSSVVKLIFSCLIAIDEIGLEPDI